MTRSASQQRQVAQLLCDWRSGDNQTLEKLIQLAEVLKIHVNTVRRDWTAARAWLFATLSGENMDAI